MRKVNQSECLLQSITNYHWTYQKTMEFIISVSTISWKEKDVIVYKMFNDTTSNVCTAILHIGFQCDFKNDTNYILLEA